MITLLAALALLGAPIQQDQGVARERLQCMAGPIQRSFGGTEWLIYGCDDHSTLIVVSAPGNPAAPFVFTLFKTEGGVQVSGEGNGDRRATATAFEDLKKLSIEDFDLTLRETETRP
jgi:hypothetical protein